MAVAGEAQARERGVVTLRLIWCIGRALAVRHVVGRRLGMASAKAGNAAQMFGECLQLPLHASSRHEGERKGGDTAA